MITVRSFTSPTPCSLTTQKSFCVRVWSFLKLLSSDQWLNEGGKYIIVALVVVAERLRYIDAKVIDVGGVSL